MKGGSITIARYLKSSTRKSVAAIDMTMALRQTGNEPGAKKEFQTALTKKPSTELTQVIQVALDNKR